MTLIAAPRSWAADLYSEGYGTEGAEPYEGDGYAESDRGLEEPLGPREGAYEEDYGEGAEGWGPEGPPAWDDVRPDGRHSLKDGYLAPSGPQRLCVPRWKIRRADGWADLRPIERRGIVVLRAERRETLRVDSCTGEIVYAAPDRWRWYGAYAPPPPRYCFRFGH